MTSMHLVDGHAPGLPEAVDASGQLGAKWQGVPSRPLDEICLALERINVDSRYFVTV
jgi:hypothetical protein